MTFQPFRCAIGGGKTDRQILGNVFLGKRISQGGGLNRLWIFDSDQNHPRLFNRLNPEDRLCNRDGIYALSLFFASDRVFDLIEL